MPIFEGGIALACEQAAAGAKSLVGVVFSAALWGWTEASLTMGQRDLAVGAGC